MMCSAVCFVLALALDCKICCGPVLVLISLELTLQEDVTLDEADPELAALDSKWAWLREGVNFKDSSFLPTANYLMFECIRVYKERSSL
jgi:hypothetical protein